MAKKPSRQQKARERKRRKRSQAKASARRHTPPKNPLLDYMRRAGREPLRECLINSSWRGFGSRIAVARDTADGIAVAMFMLDRGCRGVTDVLCLAQLSEDEYQDFLDDIRSIEELESTSIDLAAKLILAAADYGSALGFTPPKDFRAARQLLRDADPERCADDVTCGGDDGRPVYVPAADEDPEPVLKKLTARLGADGFDYFPPDDPFDALDSTAAASIPILGRDDDDLPANFAWRQLRVLEARVTALVIEFGRQTLGADFLTEAWLDFTQLTDRPRLHEDDPLYFTWFLPWAAFTWEPDDLGNRREAWPERPLGLELLAEEGHRLPELERQFLETVCARPYSFYQIVGINPGLSLELEDLLTGTRWHVSERAGTEGVRRYGILYTRIVSLNGVAIMVGGGPYEIPAHFAYSILDVRRRIQRKRKAVDESELLDWSDELHDLHLEITHQQEHPAIPQLTNTDGEPLVPVELHYRLECSPEEAASALLSLDVAGGADDPLQDPKRDRDGALQSAVVVWSRKGHKQMPGADNTVLGRLVIDGARLNIEVNSEARAERIRGEIDKRLGARAIYQRSVLHSLEKMLEAARDSGGRRPARGSDKSQEELMQSPEVQQLMAQLAEKQWETWSEEPIPALHNETPRQAAKTQAGRKRLEVLLREYAWRDQTQPEPSMRTPIARLRRELGLPPEP